MEGRVTVNNIV